MLSVQVNNISKHYRIYSRPIDGLKELILRKPYHQIHQALNNINFELPVGQALGIIGENGAGKSTLLKILAGVIKPTKGELKTSGRISAVLELGSGFHPELTGLENIRIGCAILGLSAKETEARIPEIIKFSELTDFIHRPVKTYSTGMYARLAFSIAVTIDPDIMIVDEVLSVGDEHFRKKSLDRMLSWRSQNKSLIFCSHSLYDVQQVCDLCIWIKQGGIEMLGNVNDVTSAYQDYARSLDSDLPPPDDKTVENNNLLLADIPLGQISEIKITPSPVDGTVNLGIGDELILQLQAQASSAAKGLGFGVLVSRNDNVSCYGVSNLMDKVMTRSDSGYYEIEFCLQDINLLSGNYTIAVYLLDETGLHIYDIKECACSFTVRHDSSEVGMVRLKHEWR